MHEYEREEGRREYNGKQAEKSTKKVSIYTMLERRKKQKRKEWGVYILINVGSRSKEGHVGDSGRRKSEEQENDKNKNGKQEEEGGGRRERREKQREDQNGESEKHEDHDGWRMP